MDVSMDFKGDYGKTRAWLAKMAGSPYSAVLENAGRRGVDALRSMTPVESGRTASSWSYSIKKSRGSYEIDWTNSNINEGVNIAIILQYGHGTGTGGYVTGVDYINPALRPIFDGILKDIEKAVSD